MGFVEVNDTITREYLSYIDNKDFACIGAKAALAKKQIHCFIADNIACPKDDKAILNFLYNFIDTCRDSDDLFHSAGVIFKGPLVMTEEDFDRLMWQRLQALSDLDAVNYNYDCRVDNDPASSSFSYSLKEESLFIIGMNSSSSRLLRRFNYPAMVFNPHFQFEYLRKSGKYEKMKEIVRKRDIAFSGSVNPMLKDFGDSSEVYQYSGRQYDKSWQCPLKINHAANKHNSAT
jgi:FPC/CPF motif-containing protein YcgG